MTIFRTTHINPNQRDLLKGLVAVRVIGIVGGFSSSLTAEATTTFNGQFPSKFTSRTETHYETALPHGTGSEARKFGAKMIRRVGVFPNSVIADYGVAK